MSDNDPVALRAARYMEAARWWRKESLSSACPETFLFYAENQELLANDMRAHPSAYEVTLRGRSDWQQYQRRQKEAA